MKVIIQETKQRHRRETPAPLTVPEGASLEEKIIATLRTVYDPELPVNIYDLGLIYGIKTEGKTAYITMTLTAPNCPVADEIVKDVETKLRTLKALKEASVELVFNPPWDKNCMSDAAKLELGLF